MPIEKNHPRYSQLIQVSNPTEVVRKANAYLGAGNFDIYVSDLKTKKYMIINKANGKKIHIGDINREDYTKHKDEMRRKSYLARSAGIRGNWADSKFSPNSLARNLLW